MADRKKNLIWLYFIEIETVSGKGVKVKCKQCGEEMMGIVARLKKHKEVCENPYEDVSNFKVENDKIDK